MLIAEPKPLATAPYIMTLPHEKIDPRARKENARKSRLDAQAAFMRKHPCRGALPCDFINERLNRKVI